MAHVISQMESSLTFFLGKEVSNPLLSGDCWHDSEGLSSTCTWLGWGCWRASNWKIFIFLVNLLQQSHVCGKKLNCLCWPNVGSSFKSHLVWLYLSLAKVFFVYRWVVLVGGDWMPDHWGVGVAHETPDDDGYSKGYECQGKVDTEQRYFGLLAENRIKIIFSQLDVHLCSSKAHDKFQLPVGNAQTSCNCLWDWKDSRCEGHNP